jgi:AcrR family transcriptional regulator
MAEAGTGTPRERYRTQVRAEIKEHAWAQIATAGASALSLNAIAKLMGLSGPALYRYFANRDELITDLVSDAYRSLADTLRAADADAVSLARALREWALADPHRYLLIYGTPVPGYHAPEAITSIAREIMTTLLDVYVAAPADRPAVAFDTHLEGHREWAEGHPATAASLHRALVSWTRLHGVLSLELSGHFAGMGFDPAQLYEAEVEALAG